MKNGIIALLVFIIGVLVYRDLGRDRPKPERSRVSEKQPTKADASGVIQPRSTATEPPRATESKAQTKSPDPQSSPLPENLRIIARAEVQKSVAQIYSRYFAKANLPQEKADLLMELLVDRMMVGLEPDVQSANGKQQAPDKNEQLIADLIGKDGAAELEAAKSSYLADQKAQEVIVTVFGQQQIPETQRATILDSVRGYHPGQDIFALMANKTPITPEVEATLRSDYQHRRSAMALGLQKSLGSAELAKFEAWSDTEFEKSLTFLKFIQRANAATQPAAKTAQ